MSLWKKTAGALYRVTKNGGAALQSRVKVSDGATAAEKQEILDYLLSQGLDERAIQAAIEHPDTRFAWMMRQDGITSAKLMLENNTGTPEVCDGCNLAIPRILPVGSSLEIIDEGSNMLTDGPIAGAGAAADEWTPVLQ